MPPSSGSLENEDALSRQDFLKAGWRFVLAQVAETLPDFETPSSGGAGGATLKPPGALSGKLFYETCEPFCTACITACPREAIRQDVLGFPCINPLEAPCVMCSDVPCTKVCPTEALIPLAVPSQISMGTAVIELTECTAYQGSGCRTCYDVCPMPGEAIQLIEGLPQIVPEQCTGCGACVFGCPTPRAILIRPAEGN